MAILFRALGCESDRSILSKILYDLNDGEMATALRPSIEEANSITTEEDALDYIARRGPYA